MRFSDITSRFTRSQTSSMAEKCPPSADSTISATSHQASSVATPSDMSEKILSLTEPWPPLRTTPESVPQEGLRERQRDNTPVPANTEWFSLVGQDCNICGDPCTRLVTRSSNRNGNAGRPYYKCVPCKNFVRFDDARGIDQGSRGNPLCHCGQSSRRQITSREKGRRIFYVCAIGACKYFEWYRNEDGSEWTVGEDIVAAFQRFGVV